MVREILYDFNALEKRFVNEPTSEAGISPNKVFQSMEVIQIEKFSDFDNVEYFKWEILFEVNGDEITVIGINLDYKNYIEINKFSLFEKAMRRAVRRINQIRKQSSEIDERYQNLVLNQYNLRAMKLINNRLRLIKGFRS